MIALVACVMGAVGSVGQAQRAPGGETGRVPALAAVVAAYHQRGAFDGVVLVAHGDTVLYAEAVGMANRATRQPHVLSARFPIASISKQFTAMLVMQQVARRTMRLDQPIGELMPPLRRAPSGRVTVRQLLLHSAGLPNLDGVLPLTGLAGDVAGFYTLPDAMARNPRAVVQRFVVRAVPDSSVQGKQFAYNNLDYIVLAAALEAVTGLSYATLLQQNILSPLAMRESGLVDVRNRIRGEAPPAAYDSVRGAVVPRTEWRLANYGAAGAMYSSVRDLLRWNNALLSSRLLDSVSTKQLFTPDPALGFVAPGSFVYALPGTDASALPVIDREGSIGGYQLDNLIIPQASGPGYSIIIFGNLSWSPIGGAYRGQGLAAELAATVLR